MIVFYKKSIPSTQIYLVNKFKEGEFYFPITIWTNNQTNGIGSRQNKWESIKGNLFFSTAIKKSEFDVPLQSFSIFFGYIMKITLNELNSKVVLKWPNDLYLEKKVGGIISQVVKEFIIVGIGINTKSSKNFSVLDIDIKNDTILFNFLKNLQKYKWNEIINLYKKEFETTKNRFNIKGSLEMDGSIIINNKKVYSKR